MAKVFKVLSACGSGIATSSCGNFHPAGDGRPGSETRPSQDLRSK